MRDVRVVTTNRRTGINSTIIAFKRATARRRSYLETFIASLRSQYVRNYVTNMPVQHGNSLRSVEIVTQNGPFGHRGHTNVWNFVGVVLGGFVPSRTQE